MSPQIYSYAWGNRTIPKGTLCLLIACGKLNSAMIQTLVKGDYYITDRRALRKAFLMRPAREWKQIEMAKPE